jgi:serine/threonine-protein kinase
VRALVMELVEGETLAEKIARGPLPLGEALAIARQIAEALETAHEQAIVHRDLKPANIKITPDDSVKVLDFGLAKALETSRVSASPTVTSAGTQSGVILGTAAYMAPEQAKGKPADRRADIWALGCVLFETLTGRQAFAGETFSDVLVRIVEHEPDWQALPVRTPASIHRLLHRCLEKDPRRRLDSAAVARIDGRRREGGDTCRRRGRRTTWPGVATDRLGRDRSGRRGARDDDDCGPGAYDRAAGRVGGHFCCR